jgi:hypothetical protein
VSPKTSELAAVAAALDADLQRFEQLAQAVARDRLASGRDLERVARRLAESTEVQASIGLRVSELVAGFEAARRRQDESAEQIRASAAELEARTAQYRELMDGFAALGEETGKLNEAARQPGEAEDGAALDAAADRPQDLLAWAQRIEQLVERAKRLGERAREVGFSDLVRLFDSLRQQLLSARNRLKLGLPN